MFFPISEVILRTLSFLVMVFIQAFISANWYGSLKVLLYYLLSNQQPSKSSIRPCTLSLRYTSMSSVYLGSEIS
jgi:hypothetical protein